MDSEATWKKLSVKDFKGDNEIAGNGSGNTHKDPEPILRYLESLQMNIQVTFR